MKKRELLVCWSLLVAVMLLAAGPPAAADSRLDNTTDDITESLRGIGLEVRGVGRFQLWGSDECLPTFEMMGTCFFNNPAAPYIYAVVPYWPDEFVDPATKGVFGEIEEGYGTTYRFDPHEAIVIFGYLPPEAHYLGLQSYTFTHKGKYETDNETYAIFSSYGVQDVFFHNLPLNPKRIFVFNSLSNSINNVVIKQQSGLIWEQFRYFIITPDGHLDREIRRALVALGVDNNEIFTERIPKNVRLGLNKNADDFVSPIRYAMPLDGGDEGTASYAWRHDPPLRLLRVRDTSPGYRKEPFPAWGPDSPEARTAVSEAYLDNSLTMLVHAVAEAWEQDCDDPASCTGDTFLNMQTAPFNLVGPKCTEIGMDCAGDSQDAAYQFYPGATFDDDEVWAVIGTLGTRTGNAAYVGLGLNNFQLRLGAKNIDYTKLEDTAVPYGNGDIANLDKFFVYYFARNCESVKWWTNGHCTTVEDSELVLPKGESASFTVRNYIEPDTQRGPDSTKLLPPRALKLTRPD